jgi:hypothetical protein
MRDFDIKMATSHNLQKNLTIYIYIFKKKKKKSSQKKKKKSQNFLMIDYHFTN